MVSVIIPTYNRGDLIIDTLKDLVAQKYSRFEIIIIDQSDKINKKVLNFIKKHKIISYYHILEKGTSNAKNVGATKAQGNYYIFLDDDVLIDNKDFIQCHVDNYQDKLVGAVGGRVLMGESKSQISKIKEVGKFKYFGLKEITNFYADFRSEIDHVYGCNQSYRKDVFDRVGGFSKIYKGNAHLEEADLSFKVKKSGYKIYFDPKAYLVHLHYKSGGCRTKDIYDLRYWLIHNYTVFYLRHFPKFLFPLYFTKQLVWAIFSGLKRLDWKMFKHMINAMFKGIKYYIIISKRHDA